MATLGRSRLSMLELIKDGILEPGENVLTFDYMGKRCEADLRSDGMIQWNGSCYSSPYAWASQCKNLVNPDHKSGIGWGHIRYRGIKLSQYKSVYIKKYRPSSDSQDPQLSAPQELPPTAPLPSSQLPRPRKRKQLQLATPTLPTPVGGGADQANLPKEAEDGALISVPPSGELPSDQEVAMAAVAPVTAQSGAAAAIVTHQTQQQPAVAIVAPESTPAPAAAAAANSSTVFMPCTAFEALGLQQPFSLSLYSNVLLLMDFHCHFSCSEVAGYLGGHYNATARSVEVVQAFPCRCDLTNEDQGAEMEREIRSSMAAKGLEVVGWYHSHPSSEPLPSQGDILSQKNHQETVRRECGNEPCVGVIVGPNHAAKRPEAASAFEAFWVLMVQQNGLQASPMKLKYSIAWEQYLAQDTVDEMNILASYYKSREECTKFSLPWKNDTSFLEKFKASLSAVQPKFPQENSDLTFMAYIEQLVQS